ncbi:FixH family protein [Pedobacter sp.]
MNWGTKIVLGMAAFMSFIVGMAIYMFNNYGKDALVEDDYYEKGINYNKEFNAKTNMLNDEATPTLDITKSQLIIKLKDSVNYDLALIRPSSKSADVKSKGHTIGESNLILIDLTGMGKGLWQLKLSWTNNGKDYLFTKEITL